MSLITCDEDCIYQCDGYCSLEIPSLVTNSTLKGCLHKISTQKQHKASISNNSDSKIIPPPPQMLP